MNKKKIIEIILLVLLLVCIICILVIKYVKTNTIVDDKYSQEDLEIIDNEIENYLSDKITPKGMAKLYGKYEGNNDLNDMYRGLYKFVNYLPTLSKKINFDDDKEIMSFFEKNTVEIEEKLGITELEEFEKIVGFLTTIGYDGQEFVECRLDSTTMKKGNLYFSSEITFEFKDLEAFKLKLNFANHAASKPMIYFTIIEQNKSEKIIENKVEDKIENTIENKVENII